MNTLKYTITEFSDAEKLVSVTFADGSWAKIRLMAPLPTSIEELDALVKQYASPVEHVQAMQAPTDLSFIAAAVGVEREVARFSVAEANTPPTTEAATAEAMEVLEEERLRAFILQVLAENGK